MLMVYRTTLCSQLAQRSTHIYVNKAKYPYLCPLLDLILSPLCCPPGSAHVSPTPSPLSSRVCRPLIYVHSFSFPSLVQNIFLRPCCRVGFTSMCLLSPVCGCFLFGGQGRQFASSATGSAAGPSWDPRGLAMERLGSI